MTKYIRTQQAYQFRYLGSFPTTKSDRYGVNCPLPHQPSASWTKCLRSAVDVI
jgi:hypothetical protein